MLSTAPFKADGDIVYLNVREIEFLRLLCTGRTYRQIAKLMRKSPRTIDGYRDVLFYKLSVTSNVALVVWSIKANIIGPEQIQLLKIKRKDPKISAREYQRKSQLKRRQRNTIKKKSKQ